MRGWGLSNYLKENFCIPRSKTLVRLRSNSSYLVSLKAFGDRKPLNEVMFVIVSFHHRCLMLPQSCVGLRRAHLNPVFALMIAELESGMGVSDGCKS